ncbi:MAG: DUF547 domain-containing protein [Sedimentisphaerales bacterium]
MAKHFIALIASLSVFSFIAGCPHTKPRWHGLPAHENTAKPVPAVRRPEESKVERMAVPLAKTEPNELEPTKIEPSEDELPTNEPNEVQSSAVEPNAIEPNEVEPNYVEAISRVSFHDKCAEILSKFVDKNGMVDYSRLRRQRLRLKRLLDEFDKLDPNEYKSWSREDKIAFWINAYNIQMLNIMVANYPIDASRILSLFWGPYSIRHIKGIWTDYKFMVMDEEFTLREIQQRFFHKEFDEPRIYFALSYASLSSPPLRNEPYYGYKLSQQLEDQTRRFLSSGRALKIDRDKQTVYLSAILQSTWHGQEFVDKFGTDKKFKDQQPATRAVLNFITHYIGPQDVDFLEVENYSVEYMKYDWTLNDSSRKQ